jgi:hypothetical protein
MLGTASISGRSPCLKLKFCRSVRQPAAGTITTALNRETFASLGFPHGQDPVRSGQALQTVIAAKKSSELGLVASER